MSNKEVAQSTADAPTFDETERGTVKSLLVVLAVLIAAGVSGCAREASTPSLATPVATVSGGPVASQNTSADLDAARAAVVAKVPSLDSARLTGDLASYADLELIGWWATHSSVPYKSIVVVEPLKPQSRATATPATARVWHVVQASAGAPWTVMNDDTSSE